MSIAGSNGGNAAASPPPPVPGQALIIVQFVEADVKLHVYADLEDDVYDALAKFAVDAKTKIATICGLDPNEFIFYPPVGMAGRKIKQWAKLTGFPTMTISTLPKKGLLKKSADQGASLLQQLVEAEAMQTKLTITSEQLTCKTHDLNNLQVQFQEEKAQLTTRVENLTGEVEGLRLRLGEQTNVFEEERQALNRRVRELNDDNDAVERQVLELVWEDQEMTEQVAQLEAFNMQKTWPRGDVQGGF